MDIKSEDFIDGSSLELTHALSADYGFGCTGQNVSPQLSWSGVPDEATHVTLMCFDPDAPTGSGFWHWVVANIPVSSSSLPRNASAEGLIPQGAVETRTDFGKPGYGGPCPPVGDKPHAYVFTLFAHNGPLSVHDDIPAAQVGFQLHFATVAKAQITGYFGREA
jgi:Raf kinase inhibitor-like protein, YbhB/YbcL family